MPVAAALYCRISRDAERRGLGVARQEQDLVALAERKGWDVQGTRRSGGFIDQLVTSVDTGQ